MNIFDLIEQFDFTGQKYKMPLLPYKHKSNVCWNHKGKQRYKSQGCVAHVQQTIFAANV